ncbi:MAG: hypothetical protein PS018_21490 [bacterium]|nr:hypothetical protein [bacterium]
MSLIKYLSALLLMFSAACAADRLPGGMLGKWASDVAACSEQSSELGMTVEPRSVLFYEHGYEIRRIVKLKDGSLKGVGHSVADDGRTPGSVTLKLIEPDKLQAGGETYYRCKERAGAR